MPDRERGICCLITWNWTTNTLITVAPALKQERVFRLRKVTAVFIILFLLAVLFMGAVIVEEPRQAGPVVSGPELNMTGVNVTNYSIPARYGIQPTRIDIWVGISEISLPVAKGEMAAGPRTIGFAVDPKTLLFGVVAIITGAAVIWYLEREPPEEPEDEGEDHGKN